MRKGREERRRKGKIMSQQPKRERRKHPCIEAKISPLL